jgi:hypothetical protein
MMKRRGRRTIDHALIQNFFEFENKILFCFVLNLTVYVFLPHDASAGKETIKKGRGARRNGLSSSTIFVPTIYSIFFSLSVRGRSSHLVAWNHYPNCFVKKIYSQEYG